MRFRQRLVLFFVLSMSSIACAQPDSLWSRTFGRTRGDAGYAVQQTTDGGFILGGFSDTENTWDEIWMTKASAAGDSVWSSAISAGGTSETACRAILAIPDGGCFLVAAKKVYVNSIANYDFWLIRMDANGDSLWSRTLGNDDWEFPFSLQRTNDGGYVMGGETNTSHGPNMWDMMLLKVSGSGDSLWTRYYGGAHNDICNFIVPTSDDGYLLAGSTESFGNGQPNCITDGWVVKTNASGDSVWSHAYGGIYMDEFIGAAEVSDGYLLAGTTNSFGPDTPGYLNFWLVKINSNGDTLWTRTYGGSGTDRCNAFLALPDGGAVLFGTTFSFSSGESDMWLVRVDANGNMLWNRAFGGSRYEAGNCVARTSDGGYILGGSTDTFGFADMWLVRTGPDGGGSSETTLLSEGFEGSFPPTDWQAQQLQGTSQNWHLLTGASEAGCGDSTHSGSNAVFHNDDRGTSGLDARDMLISPTITIPQGASNIRLSFFQRNCYVPSYYADSTHHWVLSSINGGSWTLLTEPNQRQAEWAEIRIPVSITEGQQLRIAFDYQGDYATEWYVDDVRITANTPQVAPQVRPNMPTAITLLDPYPNPFNSVMRISFILTAPARTELVVFNVLGQQVATLLDASLQSAGHHTITWSAACCASGMYVIRLRANDQMLLRKVLLIR
jgi:hypothetical protein